MNSNPFQERLAAIEQQGNLRRLPSVKQQGKLVYPQEGAPMVNLSSNDYLGLASDTSLLQRFYDENESLLHLPFSSSSSRLLTGNFEPYAELEERLKQLYHSQAALFFNSGYHANIGILPAITTSRSLILADKLVHASLIDGIRLSPAKVIRYRHNDYEQLERLLQQHASHHDCVVVVTESIFSMDGDTANLPALVELKKCYSNLLLYVDEAHAVGAVGEQGLGLSEATHTLADIDILVGTMGKALASVGAYVICNGELAQWLVNTMRSLIFTTALPPINLHWSNYILAQIPQMQQRREQLQRVTRQLLQALPESSRVSQSHILPLLVGESQAAVALAQAMQREGFYLLPVRPPTVPVGTSRLRISMSAAITEEEVARLIPALQHHIQQLGL